jgi:hypothetical protein
VTFAKKNYDSHGWLKIQEIEVIALYVFAGPPAGFHLKTSNRQSLLENRIMQQPNNVNAGTHHRVFYPDLKPGLPTRRRELWQRHPYLLLMPLHPTYCHSILQLKPYLYF